MPNLRGILLNINTALAAGQFATQKFQAGRYNLLAYQMITVEGEETIKQPAIVDNTGEGVDVSIDDTFPIEFYHRNTAITPELVQADDFGDPGEYITEVYDMVLICIGNRNKLKVVPEDVISAIWSSFPKEQTEAQNIALSLSDCKFEPGTVNINPEEVWNQEYVGVEYKLKPSQFMLAVQYKITLTYKCFTLCN